MILEKDMKNALLNLKCNWKGQTGATDGTEEIFQIFSQGAVVAKPCALIDAEKNTQCALRNKICKL